MKIVRRKSLNHLVKEAIKQFETPNYRKKGVLTDVMYLRCGKLYCVTLKISKSYVCVKHAP